MKINEKGFSFVEVLVILVIVGLIGTVGWLVYDRQHKNDNLQTKTQTNVQTGKASNATAYTFKELGISMDVLQGWSVKTNHTKQEDVNFYDWTVEKTGADGKISLVSTGFRGGFTGCSVDTSPLSAGTVREVAPTQNPNLMFLSWSYTSSGETTTNTGIVRTDEAIFKTSNSFSAVPIANKDVKAGTYYICLAEPLPGYSLKLNSEASPGYARLDRISAVASSSSNTQYKLLPADAKSNADIKTMLTSIK